MEHKIVLVVDEDHDFSSIIEMKLKSAGFDVQVATVPQIGLQLAEKVAPGLILLDINMPGMNGIEFLSKLRDDGKIGDTKVVFFSSMVNPWHNNTDIREVAKGLGAVEFIDKSIDLDQLVKRVRELIAAPEAGKVEM